MADRRKPVPLWPDLAGEVASPDQRWPASQHVDVWRAGQLDRLAVTCNAREALDGADVIPGFSFPVAAISEDPLDDAAPADPSA